MLYHLSCLLTNPMIWALLSAWASAQSNRVFIVSMEKQRPFSTHEAHSEDYDHIAQMQADVSLCWTQSLKCWICHVEAQRTYWQGGKRHILQTKGSLVLDLARSPFVVALSKSQPPLILLKPRKLWTHYCLDRL